MLTIPILIFEIWKSFRRPRASVGFVRKSSFRTGQRPQNLQQPQQQQQQQVDTKQTTQHSLQQQQQLQPPQKQQDEIHSNSSSPSDDRKIISGRIPIPAKQIIPAVSPQQQSYSIQPEVASTPPQASPPSQIPSPRLQQPPQQQLLQQQQQQQQPQQPQQQQQQQVRQAPPSHIPTPVQKSVKTLVLEPSISGNKMSEGWAQLQVEKFQFTFDQADKDKSGSLSFDEVYNVLKANGFKGTNKEAQFIFGHMDKDGSHAVSKDEFNAAMKALPKISIKEFVLRKAFLQLDKDGSGFLTRTEIEDATKNEGEIDIAAKKISDLLIYLIKEDTDQKVSYEEFLRVFGIEATACVMKRAFIALDADGSGFLSRDEILEAVKTEFELKLSAGKISDLLIYMVKDEDKKISYNEFVDVWLQQKEKK